MKRLLVVLILALTVIAGAQEQSLNNEAVLKMVQAGLGEDLIVTMVRTQPGKYTVTADEMIKLKQAGVSDKILTAIASKMTVGMTSSPIATGAETIPADTPVRLAVDEAVSSSTATLGQAVKLVVADDVFSKGGTVIAKGAPAAGRVTTVSKSSGSHDGQLEVAIDSVRAVDGKTIQLYGHATVGGGMVPFTRKSHEANLEKGHIIVAIVAKNSKVNE